MHSTDHSYQSLEQLHSDEHFTNKNHSKFSGNNIFSPCLSLTVNGVLLLVLPLVEQHLRGQHHRSDAHHGNARRKQQETLPLGEHSLRERDTDTIYSNVMLNLEMTS